MEARNLQVHKYLCSLFTKEKEEMKFVREHSREIVLPEIAINPHVGQMISLLGKLKQPRRILEIGTLAGYSTLWLADILPEDGQLITLEKNPSRVQIAKEHFQKSPTGKKVTILEGDALELLNDLQGPFDLVFIDGDKSQYFFYFSKTLPLCQKGSLILLDNLIPKRGDINAPCQSDLEAVAIYEFNEWLSKHPMVDSTVLPTIVGGQGRLDGLGLCLVKG